MPTPTRPVSGAPIASAWGQPVHDDTFAPKGSKVTGAVVAMLAGAAWRFLPMDTAESDPGGWLDAVNDRLQVPVGAEGLYTGFVWCTSDDGATSDSTRVAVLVNGVEVGRANELQEGADAITLVIPLLETFAAGDLITVRALQVGTGARANVRMRRLSFVRLGRELGA